MVIARIAVFPTLTEWPNEASELTNDKSEFNEVYKPSKRKKSQICTHADLMKNDKQRVEQDHCNKFKISKTYV